MGTAFAGLADDPSAIMHNPAGLTQVKGTNIYSGVTALIPSSEYTSPSGASEETDFNVFFPPHFYICSDFDLESLTNPSRARPWHLTFEAEWLNWSRFDHQTLDFEHEVPGAGFSDMVIDFDWKDQWFIKFGLEY